MTIAAPDVTMRVSGLSAASGGPAVAHPPDPRLFWVCPGLTPLPFTEVWERLNDSQKLRYNQLNAVYIAEVIAGFEAVGSRALLLLRSRLDAASPLAQQLTSVVGDEATHIARWHALLPGGKPAGFHALAGETSVVSTLANAAVRRPQAAPLLFWLMLAMEERGVEISRRCLLMPRDELDPAFSAMYRDHLRDEVRHVQFDVQLVEHFYEPLPRRWRKAIAWCLKHIVARVLLAPRNAARQIIPSLIKTHPELTELESTIHAQLTALDKNPQYHEMMYSRRCTPLLFELFDRYPEMHAMKSVLASYEPPRHG